MKQNLLTALFQNGLNTRNEFVTKPVDITQQSETVVKSDDRKRYLVRLCSIVNDEMLGFCNILALTEYDAYLLAYIQLSKFHDMHSKVLYVMTDTDELNPVIKKFYPDLVDTRQYDSTGRHIRLGDIISVLEKVSNSYQCSYIGVVKRNLSGEIVIEFRQTELEPVSLSDALEMHYCEVLGSVLISVKQNYKQNDETKKADCSAS